MHHVPEIRFQKQEIAVEFVYSAKNPDAPVAFASFGAMHSVFEIVVPGVSEQEARNVAAKAETMVAAVEKKLS